MATYGNGIWLRFNKKGTLISKITNGHTIRQHGSFTLFFTFDDESIITGKSLSVGFQKPGEKEPAFFLAADNENQYKFKKYKANEITYGLEDEKTYNAFKVEVPSNLGITNKYGDLILISRIYAKNGTYIDGTFVDANNDEVNDNTENDDTIFLQGSVRLYIEPTYGDNSGTSDVSINQYENLVSQIGARLNKNGDTATNLTINGGAATNLTISSGTISKTVIIGEEGNIAIGQNDLDEGLSNKVNKTNDTATNLTITSGTINNEVKIGNNSNATAENILYSDDTTSVEQNGEYLLLKVITLTQEQYNDLESIDPTAFYFIVEE